MESIFYGRKDRPHIEIVSAQHGGLKVAVLDKLGHLQAFVYTGPDGAGDYDVHRVDSYSRRAGVDVLGVLRNHLTPERFNAALAA
jgi:hypothetical protein